MSTETCKLCNKDCTPWVHINGHICQDCYAKPKWISVDDEIPAHLQCFLGVGASGRMMVLRCDQGLNNYVFLNPEMTQQIIGLTYWMPLPSLPEIINET